MQNKIKLKKERKKRLFVFLIKLIFILFALCIVIYNIIIRISDTNKIIYYESEPFAVQVPLNKIVLVKSGKHLGAFKIIRKISKSGFLNGVKYEYWYIGDGSKNLLSSKVEHGIGYVYEKYEYEKGSNNVIDKRSKLNIKVGPFLIEWSLGNYIYIKSYYDSSEKIKIINYKIAATNWSKISEINLSDKKLKWIGEN